MNSSRAVPCLDASTLADLAARVQAAAGDDPSIFGRALGALVPLDDDLFRGRVLLMIGAEAWESAALALVERVLPGWTGAVHKRRDGVWLGEIDGLPISRRLHEIHSRRGSTPALALLSALLAALANRPETPE